MFPSIWCLYVLAWWLCFVINSSCVAVNVCVCVQDLCVCISFMFRSQFTFWNGVWTTAKNVTLVQRDQPHHNWSISLGRLTLTGNYKTVVKKCSERLILRSGWFYIWIFILTGNLKMSVCKQWSYTAWLLKHEHLWFKSSRILTDIVADKNLLQVVF